MYSRRFSCWMKGGFRYAEYSRMAGCATWRDIPSQLEKGGEIGNQCLRAKRRWKVILHNYLMASDI